MTKPVPINQVELTMYFNQSFVLKTCAPNREEINPDKLAKVDIVRADRDFKDSLFDFSVRHVRKVHSDDFICKSLKLSQGMSFLDFIGPKNIAYVIAVFKNSKDMWDQDIQIQELWPAAMGNPKKKLKPIFTSGGGQKHVQGKSLWNKEGMRYFRSAEENVGGKRSVLFRGPHSSIDSR